LYIISKNSSNKETQTIVKWVARIDGGIQKKVKEPQPKPPLYLSPQTHPPKNLKI
jgi:hypothetical protein